MHLVSTNEIFMSAMASGTNRVDFRLDTHPVGQHRDWETSAGWPAPKKIHPLWRGYGSSVLVPNVGNTLGGRDLVMNIGGGTNYNTQVVTATTNDFTGTAVPVLTAETYDKVYGWLEEAAQSSPRMYHSTAGLLPSGRVVSAGGDVRTWDYEVFTPDFLPAASNVCRPCSRSAVST